MFPALQWPPTKSPSPPPPPHSSSNSSPSSSSDRLKAHKSPQIPFFGQQPTHTFPLLQTRLILRHKHRHHHFFTSFCSLHYYRSPYFVLWPPPPPSVTSIFVFFPSSSPALSAIRDDGDGWKSISPSLATRRPSHFQVRFQGAKLCPDEGN